MTTGCCLNISFWKRAGGFELADSLNKRENYRAASDNFDAEKVARYNDARIVKLMNNPGIIRNRLKIRSTIQNAKAFLKVREAFGSFDAYF